MDLSNERTRPWISVLLIFGRPQIVFIPVDDDDPVHWGGERVEQVQVGEGAVAADLVASASDV